MDKIGVLLLAIIFTAGAGAAQDPTAPLGKVKPKPVKIVKARSYPLPRLQGIVCEQGADCVAMLNDRILTRGDRVAGYQIKGITSDIVTLTRAGKQWRLELFNSNVKQ